MSQKIKKNTEKSNKDKFLTDFYTALCCVISSLYLCVDIVFKIWLKDFELQKVVCYGLLILILVACFIFHTFFLKRGKCNGKFAKFIDKKSNIFTGIGTAVLILSFAVAIILG